MLCCWLSTERFSGSFFCYSCFCSKHCSISGAWWCYHARELNIEKQNVHVLCLDSRIKRKLKQGAQRYRQLKTSGHSWKHWQARAVISYSWRDRCSTKDPLFLSPNKSSISLQQRINFSSGPRHCDRFLAPWMCKLYWKPVDSIC